MAGVLDPKRIARRTALALNAMIATAALALAIRFLP
jgi:hypothetical protein